ncbi:potassium channel family protein [Streptomyces fradiae]|uniref:potassium channel family protein n=1 Tax=Streptomyces fradiae TaxID=1906 RepID=UPI0033E28676
MSGSASWIVSAAGAVLLLTALRDVFHTLWHPGGRGEASRRVSALLWRVSRRAGGRAAAVAGPLALVVVAAGWAVAIVVGWALIYWPFLPQGFSYSGTLDPAQRAGFLDALYLSLVTLSTLGFGDIVPVDGWLRAVTPLEALVGFALLTAVVSWISQVYPALTRRRTLALRLAALRGAEYPADRFDPATTAHLLSDLAADVIEVRVDFVQHAETYYFHDGDGDASLAAMAGYAVDLAVRGQTSARIEVRTAAAMLARALEDLAAVLNQQFLHVDTDEPSRVLRAYETDHAGGSRPARG